MTPTEKLTAVLPRRKTKPTLAQSITTRFTEEEFARMVQASTKRGMKLEAWAREIIVRSMEEDSSDPAIFTELVALRLLFNSQLRAIQGQQANGKNTSAQFSAELRRLKQDISHEVLARYRRTA